MNAHDPAICAALEPRDLGVGVAVRSRGGGVDRVLEHEARVIRGAVEVLEHPAQTLGAELRLERERGLHAAERLVEARRAEQRERVVDPQADVHQLETGLRALVDRDQERQRAHEVRRDLGLDATLRDALEHEPDLAVLEIAQAAVDELARLRRCARGVVALLEQGDLHPAELGITCDAGAGDASADHDDVIGHGGHGTKIPGERASVKAWAAQLG